MKIALNATEIFQLAALGPCIFVLFYLIFSARNLKYILIPFLYFINLSLFFLLPILSLFPELGTEYIANLKLYNDFIIPEISFLLILQFILGHPPALKYWLVFALPIIGGGPVIMLSEAGGDVCFSGTCVPSGDFLTIYRVIGAALIFMLLTLILRRIKLIRKTDTSRRHKYWLIVLLILFNLLLLGIDLTHISGKIAAAEIDFIKTMIGVVFVYLVPSSLFRVFNNSLYITPINKALFERDTQIANKIIAMLEGEQLYKKSDFSRGKLADMLGLTEQHLSRIINQNFGQSFSELVNNYRVRDAKEMLEHKRDKIYSICIDAGFDNMTSFNRVFKKATGLSPNQYREEIRKLV